MLGVQQRRCGRHDGAEGGRERGEPQPPGAQAAVDREFVLGRVETAYDFRGALGEQAARVGQPDPAPGTLDELSAGFRLEPGEVVADRGLRVVERVGRGRHRAVPGHSDQHAEPRNVQHDLTIDRIYLSAQVWIPG
jgi:hypothetical protein